MISDEFDKNYKVNVSHATMDYLFQSIRAGDEEIERLTKQNKALNEMYELTKKEYIRLNNIINELEKYLIERIEYNQGSELQDYLENPYSTIYSVLQELKGSDKE